MMNGLIADFTSHLREAIEVGKKTNFTNTDNSLMNVLICGLGGSGIGGTIISQLISEECQLPITVCKDYRIPSFVNQDTLVICCSYSGNTEETLEMYDQAYDKGAEIVIITSGGKFAEIATDKGHNMIQIKGGFPPRAAFGISFPQLFFVFHQYGLISDSFLLEIEGSIQLMDAEENAIQSEAKELAGKIYGTLPIIYTEAPMEGVAIRFRQQINENSKMLCWHSVIPEMNHNELVGWRTENKKLSVIVFRSKDEYYRNTARITKTKEIAGNYTSNINDVFAKGEGKIQQSLYLIHLGDWISYELSVLKEIDSVEVDVITGLKNMLAKLD
ncbi:MAG: bifunctional phosphoglucose/phosphomannose isomerase [Flavobacteriales bacterium]|nr:bifunctional phosphoglucose/phosphomannose isomerase [Flavobacteriales bacterium]